MPEQAPNCGLCGGPIAVGAETWPDPRTPNGVCHTACVERWEGRNTPPPPDPEPCKVCGDCWPAAACAEGRCGPVPKLAQPTPVHGPMSQEVGPRARADMALAREHQRRKGMETYGVPLATFDGRSKYWDAMTELADLEEYIPALEMEREHWERRAGELEQQLANYERVTLLDIQTAEDEISAKIGVPHWAMRIIGENLADSLKGAPNYLEVTLAGIKDRAGEEYVVTVRRKEGKTPHEFRMEAEQERNHLAGLLKRAMEAFMQGVYPFELMEDIKATGILGQGEKSNGPPQ